MLSATWSEPGSADEFGRAVSAVPRRASAVPRTRRQNRRRECPCATQGHAEGYDPRFEHDACGVAFVATLTGIAGHDIVDLGLAALRNLEHRGASGAEPESGDGAGLLVQVPDAFLREVAGFELPAAGGFAVGLAFLPDDDQAERATMDRIDELAAEERLTVLGWRDVPTAPALLGATARSAMPRFRQLFVAGGPRTRRRRRPDLARPGPPCLLPAQAGRAGDAGLLPEPVLPHAGLQGHAHDRTAGAVLPGLSDRRRVGDRRRAFAVLDEHLPELATRAPVPFIAHNGEINTVMGNRNWMRARESQLATDLIPGDLSRLFPICTPGRATRPASTRCSSCCISAGGASPTRCS